MRLSFLCILLFSIMHNSLKSMERSKEQQLQYIERSISLAAEEKLLLEVLDPTPESDELLLKIDKTLKELTDRKLALSREIKALKQRRLPINVSIPDPLTTPKLLTEPVSAVIEPMDIELIELGGVEPYISQEEIEEKLRSDLIKLNNTLTQLRSKLK